MRRPWLPSPTALSPARSSPRLDRSRRGGFFGVFALLLADFHVRFTSSRASYLDAQPLVDTAFAVLARRAPLALAAAKRAVGSRGAPSARPSPMAWPRTRAADADDDDDADADAADASTSASARSHGTATATPDAQAVGAEAFRALFQMYVVADPRSDAGPEHARDVHALLSSTAARRAGSVSKMRAAVRLVALREVSVATSAATSAPYLSARSTLPGSAPGSVVGELPMATATVRDGVQGALASGEASVGRVRVALAIEAQTDGTARVRLRPDAPPERAPEPVRRRRRTTSALVQAAIAARDRDHASPSMPLTAALPTSSTLRAGMSAKI